MKNKINKGAPGRHQWDYLYEDKLTRSIAYPAELPASGKIDEWAVAIEEKRDTNELLRQSKQDLSNEILSKNQTLRCFSDNIFRLPSRFFQLCEVHQSIKLN